ncbi:protein ENL isoform X2 [Syngnathus typhle]|uniref:protein ENL isoform X2 n=1 Tax=Syngnathus typhle TaxID=161592 RepID=UPI002A6B2F50|nr:protein ENL isoform X2 [Syngnathus typhle]
MENQCTVQVKLELGHRAQLRKKVTSEGFTHDWMVFVRGPENGDIQHFVDKVVFRLHESFPKPKRVCKEPPYKVEESGYAGFLMLIEVYFKNKEEPKKVCFNYDLFLNLEGNPPVNHLRCEKLTFNNPTKDFRKKLIKAGGVLVVPEVAEAVSRPSPDYPILPTIPLSAFSDPKKTKTSHVSKEPSKEGGGGGGGSSKGPKPHKMTKEHRERPRKDSESKASSKGDNDRDGSGKSGRDSSSTSSSKKPSDIKVKDEVKVLPKAAFKEPKLTLKESKMEGMSPKGGGAGSGGGGGGGGGGGSAESKAPSKRPSTVESPKPSAKKQKKGSSEGPKGPSGAAFTGSPRVSSSSAATQPYADKKHSKEKGRWAKSKNDTQDLKEPKKLPESEDSNSEDEASSKSESAPSSPSNSSSSSDSSSDSDFEPGQKPGQGPLRSMVEEIQSEESDDDDSSSEEGTPVKTNPPNRDSRLSLDSESDSSDGSHRPSRDPAPPPQKHSSSNNNKVSGRKSPDSSFRSEKVLKKGYDKIAVGLANGSRCLDKLPLNSCQVFFLAPHQTSFRRLSFNSQENIHALLDIFTSLLCNQRIFNDTLLSQMIQAYTEELVDLHRRLMALRERNVLQQIVNLIEETGHFNVTNTTFDFDLFSLDESTVRKLQSYLEATAT